MTRLLRTSLLAAALTMPAGQAAISQSLAQGGPSYCGERSSILETLATKYGEVRQSIGLAPQGGVFEVFASPQTGTWTIMVTTARGKTCLLASGRAFETFAQNATPAGDEI